jgi:hypothetical protein
MENDMKSNNVEYEAVGQVDGVSVKVKALATATGTTYQEAWLKAQAAAKSDADSKLADVLKKIENNGSVTEIVIKGDPGPPGPPGSIGYTGNRGPRGTAGLDGKNLTQPTINVNNSLSLSVAALDTIQALAKTKLIRDTNITCLLKSALKVKIYNTYGPFIDFIHNVDACLRQDSANNTCTMSLDNTQAKELTDILNNVFNPDKLDDVNDLIEGNFLGLELDEGTEVQYLEMKAWSFISIPTATGNIEMDRFDRIKFNFVTSAD